MLTWRVLPAQTWGPQYSRVWLAVERDGIRIFTWGEVPENGLGFAPHEEAEVNVVVPLADSRAGDHIQVHTPHIQLRPFGCSG